MRVPLRRLRSDRGSAGLEIVILAPVLVALLVLLAAAGRLALAGNAVDAAAANAARAASLARTADEAQSSATQTAETAMAQSGVSCLTLTVNIDTSGLNTPVGTTGRVGADVSCVISLSDSVLIGLPGTHTLRGNFVSPVDAYRERQ